MKDGKEELGTEPSTCAVPHHWSDKSVEPKGKAFIYQSINVLKKTPKAMRFVLWKNNLEDK